MAPKIPRGGSQAPFNGETPLIASQERNVLNPGSKDRTRFFVAGVPKAGTTALCRFLAQHPQVFMCPVKEPSFFAARDVLRIEQSDPRSALGRAVFRRKRWVAGAAARLSKRGVPLDWNAYEALFTGVRDEIAVGEGSTVYCAAPGAPQAIHERFPDARFVLMLRDPADRCFSHYRSMIWKTPLRSYREWLESLHACPERWGIILEFGRHATNLERLFKYFPRRQVSIHLYEDFCADPRAVCRNIFSFLGVDSEYSVDTSERVNEPRLPRWPRLHALRQAIAPSRALSAMIPRRWREPLRRLYHAPRSRAAMDPADRRVLVDYYRDEILRTSELIGRDLSSWLR